MSNITPISGTAFPGDAYCNDAFELDLEHALGDTVEAHCEFALSALKRVKADNLSPSSRLVEIEAASLAHGTAVEVFAALSQHGHSSSTSIDLLTSIAWQALNIAIDGVTPSNNELTNTDTRLGELDVTDKLVGIVERTTAVVDYTGRWGTGILAASIVLTNRLGAVCCDPMMNTERMSSGVDRRTEMAIANKAAPILARLYTLSKALERANIRPE